MDTIGESSKPIGGKPTDLFNPKEKIEREFTYHKPFGDQPERYVKIRDKAKELALLIAELTPSCPDQTVAIRKVREAVMTANAAIAINEVKPPEPNQP